MVIKVSKILIKGNKIVKKKIFPEIVFFFRKGVSFMFFFFKPAMRTVFVNTIIDTVCSVVI